MLKNLFLLGCVLITASCSSSRSCYYGEYVMSFVGKSQDELLLAFGTPTGQFKGDNGTTIIQYKKVKITPEPYGEVNLWSVIALREERDKNDYDCETDFMLRNGKVISCKWEGNCKNLTPEYYQTLKER